MSDKFVAYYQSLGAENVTAAPIYEREDAFNEACIRPLREAALIFIGWGTASRLLEVLRGSPALAAIEEAHQRGAVLACMSAGARFPAITRRRTLIFMCSTRPMFSATFSGRTRASRSQTIT